MSQLETAQRHEVPALSALSSGELVSRAQAGDRQAFEELYFRFYPAIARRLSFMLGPSSAAVQDLAQETFIRAYQGLDRYRAEAHVSHWLLRIASNLARSTFRRRMRSMFRLWDRPVREAQVPSPGKRVDETYPALQAVQRALQRLSPPLREAVILFELEGLSLAEMAAELDVSINTAGSRVRRGRDQLRAALLRMGFAPIGRPVVLCNGDP